MTSKIRYKRKDGSELIRYQARPRGMHGIPVYLGQFKTREEAKQVEDAFINNEAIKADREKRRRQ